MNVYDFDNTILRGDSSARFFAWCLVHRPRMWRDVPGQAVNGLMFLLKLRPKQAFKQRMFHYLTLIGDVDGAVEAFWADNFSRVKAWYPPRHREDDVVISASPEFRIRPAASSARRWTSAPGCSWAPTATARRRFPGSTPASPGPGSTNSSPTPTPTIPWPRWRSGRGW